ncbi:WXG100 family type VII secretion target [Streptomyces sp. NPDC052693]|uniref:WXG100 family type VII secretion target n=1 Tax=Streptomyces sp. NPDC052693 TaxID=3155814 RepID=UPI00341E6392
MEETEAAQMRQTLQDTIDANENLMNQLSRLNAAVDGVVWQGAASTAYKTLMTSFNDDAQRLNEALLTMAEQVADSGDA